MDERKPPSEFLPGIRDVSRALDMLEEAVCGAELAEIAKKYGLSPTRTGDIIRLTLRTLNLRAAEAAGRPIPRVPLLWETRQKSALWRERIGEMRKVREIHGGYAKSSVGSKGGKSPGNR